MKRPHKSEAGFTLIEVLAAMVIFSVAILGLSHANTQSLRGGAAIEAKTLAGIVADNQLIVARYKDIEKGVRRGTAEQMGREFDWVMETSDTGIPNFLQMEISVSELCLLYTSPSPRDQRGSRMPSSA